MNKEKTVIIDIGSNCREFRTTVKTTPEEMERLRAGFRQLIDAQPDLWNTIKKKPSA